MKDEEEADDLAQLGVSDKHGTGHDQVLSSWLKRYDMKGYEKVKNMKLCKARRKTCKRGAMLEMPDEGVLIMF